jgi:hypothetical protein
VTSENDCEVCVQQLGIRSSLSAIMGQVGVWFLFCVWPILGIFVVARVLIRVCACVRFRLHPPCATAGGDSVFHVCRVTMGAAVSVHPDAGGDPSLPPQRVRYVPIYIYIYIWLAVWLSGCLAVCLSAARSLSDNACMLHGYVCPSCAAMR